MPKPRPPYVVKDTSRHGKTRWYYRRPGRPRIRLPDEYDSPEFKAAYDAAVRGKPMDAAGRQKAGTLGWLVAQYRDSPAWRSLSAATRRQREGILAKALASAADAPVAAIDRRAIVEGRDRRADTPAAARHFIETMRGLFQWALDAEHVAADPTQGVKGPRKTGPGFHTWTDDECAGFERRWPIGTRERLAFDVLLYTGLRRGDAVRVGWQHVRDGLLSLETQKTGEPVFIPVLPPLAASLDAGPVGRETWIAGAGEKPLTKESFGNWFREACNAAGLAHCSAHGLRKAGATRAAEAGATVNQLEAMFGWRGGGMASLYTKRANRKKMAQEGFLKTHQPKGAATDE